MRVQGDLHKGFLAEKGKGRGSGEVEITRSIIRLYKPGRNTHRREKKKKTNGGKQIRGVNYLNENDQMIE